MSIFNKKKSMNDDDQVEIENYLVYEENGKMYLQQVMTLGDELRNLSKEGYREKLRQEQIKKEKEEKMKREAEYKLKRKKERISELEKIQKEAFDIFCNECKRIANPGVRYCNSYAKQKVDHYKYTGGGGEYSENAVWFENPTYKEYDYSSNDVINFNGYELDEIADVVRYLTNNLSKKGFISYDVRAKKETEKKGNTITKTRTYIEISAKW